MKKIYVLIPGVLIIIGIVLAMIYIPARSQPSPPTLTSTPSGLVTLGSEEENIPSVSTPTPLLDVIDLAPELPEYDKATIIIEHPDRSHTKVLLVTDMVEEFKNQLPEGDKIVDIIPPQSLMGHEPPRITLPLGNQIYPGTSENPGTVVGTPPPEPTLASPTNVTQTYIPMLGDLINIIYASDPSSPQYDPASIPYSEFPDALQQLSGMGPKAINAASHIALAISFPREDSYLAAQTLISLGPDITATTLPTLIDNLHRQRPATRLYSAIVLGTVGKAASCSVGDIGPLLWDADPSVRSAAAYALARITGEDLSPDGAMVIPAPLSSQSIILDMPEGKIVGAARKWWTAEGSKVNWHPSYDLCDP